jgi:teichoic acid transport system ATP-binding protein
VTELSDKAPIVSESESPISVSIRSADVKYRVYQERSYSMREMVSGGFKKSRSTIVHAVNDVSFDVRIGEAVGIVGSNGSGKSTLLRAVAGLQALESGSIKVRGSAHLLSVSGALKPTLSGFRNVLLGGLAMGMSREEIDAQMDGIVEFSGLGEAMARPMKTYSSGMKARLSFSIATLRVPEILLIDEALAVGDKEFRAQSLQRVNEIRDQAGTILMVTHNLNEIRESCTRAVWLEKGVLVADGDVADVLGQYESR